MNTRLSISNFVELQIARVLFALLFLLAIFSSRIRQLYGFVLYLRRYTNQLRSNLRKAMYEWMREILPAMLEALPLAAGTFPQRYGELLP